ncbi:MAG: hypothetical protein N2376_06190 [Clostridia bacterium]|nr:hypothetical protein [Clostridia bacterium]
MSKKILVSLLSLFLSTLLILATLNPSSVMALVGLTSLDAKAMQRTQTEMAKTLNDGMKKLAASLGRNTKLTRSSDDGAVVICVTKNTKNVAVKIQADTTLMDDVDFKDIGKVTKMAKTYLKSILTEKQATGLCGLLFAEAYAQYKKGKTEIKMTKEFDGVTISCTGDVDLGTLEVNLVAKLGVTQCPSKSKTTVMKVLPL